MVRTRKEIADEINSHKDNIYRLKDAIESWQYSIEDADDEIVLYREKIKKLQKEWDETFGA